MKGIRVAHTWLWFSKNRTCYPINSIIKQECKQRKPLPLKSRLRIGTFIAKCYFVLLVNTQKGKMQEQNAMKIGEVSRSLDVSTQTVRNYLRLAPDQFSGEAVRKSNKQFTPQDIAVLQEIKYLVSEGVKYKNVADQLPLIPEIVENIGPEPDQPQEQYALQPVEFFDHFKIMLEQMQLEHGITISAKDQTIATLQAENDWLKRPFWQKWFGSPA